MTFPKIFRKDAFFILLIELLCYSSLSDINEKEENLGKHREPALGLENRQSLRTEFPLTENEREDTLVTACELPKQGSLKGEKEVQNILVT